MAVLARVVDVLHGALHNHIHVTAVNLSRLSLYTQPPSVYSSALPGYEIYYIFKIYHTLCTTYGPFMKNMLT